MEQCINSDPPYYLLGNVSLGDPHHICNITIRQLDVVWIGVVRQIYASIDQGMLSFIFDIFVQQLKEYVIQRVSSIHETIDHYPNILVTILLSNDVCITCITINLLKIYC